MSPPRVVIHIGLHKTATRFLQRAVFRQLDRERFLVNPEPLFHDLRQAVRHPGDASWARAAGEAADQARREAGERTLLLSDPSISGDMYSSHDDYRQNLELVHRLFPDAHIIYFVRRQSDWLQSAYRQSLVKGKGAPIERFLNFYGGTFRQRPGPRVHGVRTVEALTLHFLDIYLAYAERYGAERVYLFRQEDLRRRAEAVYQRLAEALGIQSLPQLPGRVSANRAFSALAIRLFFPSTLGTPTPPPAGAASAGPAPGARRLTAPLRRLRTLLIKHGFDRLIYRDWDLLARHGMREQLDAHYADEYRRLSAIAEAILDEGPGPQARAEAEAEGAPAHA